uniref:Uncharacterized protein n=1 Tax=Timema tahoe TaxID=61484 RepID=A0A7R9IQD7_9NEOP|nr:unnamed protein product [Timema tahoe]
MCSALGSGRYLEEGQEGNVPCPIVYGAVVDSACLVWETTCGERGACWLYDANVFRMFFHGPHVKALDNLLVAIQTLEHMSMTSMASYDILKSYGLRVEE